MLADRIRSLAAAIGADIKALREGKLDASAPHGQLPVWTTATRPAAPAAGLMGFNQTFAGVEVWSGAAWVRLDARYRVFGVHSFGARF